MFAVLSPPTDRSTDLDPMIDDALYDPYDRAHRRGEFASADFT